MRIALLFLLAALAGCRALPDPAEGATFVIVRHGEKATDDPKDPSLAPAGEKRAARLAARLGREPVVAVYATGFRRTQSTAAPTARAHGLAVTPYDAAMPAADFARDLRARHAAGTVLVVGHSNTVPAIAQALCGCTIEPIPDAEYGRRITLRALPDGRVTVDDRREP
jgi:broad specificity phosphatase PhoE